MTQTCNAIRPHTFIVDITLPSDISSPPLDNLWQLLVDPAGMRQDDRWGRWLNKCWLIQLVWETWEDVLSDWGIWALNHNLWPRTDLTHQHAMLHVACTECLGSGELIIMRSVQKMAEPACVRLMGQYCTHVSLCYNSAISLTSFDNTPLSADKEESHSVDASWIPHL